MLRKRVIHESKTEPHRHVLPVPGLVVAGISPVWFCADVRECADRTESASGAGTANFHGAEYAEPAGECTVVPRSPDAGYARVVELEAGGRARDQEQSANLGRAPDRSCVPAGHAGGEVELLAHGHGGHHWSRCAVG